VDNGEATGVSPVHHQRFAATPMPADQPLLERAGELAALRAAVRTARAGAGAVVVVEGEAGIGKTALLGAAADEAAGGMTLLRARATELERPFGFGVVRQLYQRVARRHAGAGVFDGPARPAATVLGLDDHAPGDPRAKPPLERVFPALDGLWWLTLNLAERRPLALLVDDAQWIDAASERFLAHLAARIDDVPLVLLITQRPGPDADRLRHRLGRPEVLTPARLTPEGTATLVRTLLPEADEAFCAACFAATNGNAFYVREIATGHRAAAAPPAPSDLAQWSPERVTRDVAGRIAALDADAREVTRACVILGDGAPPHRVAALAGVDDDTARAALDTLRTAGLLADRRPVEFAHPIVRAAAEASIPPGLRAGAHARAARLEASAGATAERIAVHLLGSDPAGDPWACERLAHAARDALARGAPDAAATYLERALQEPPEPEQRVGLLLELGTAAAFAFRPGAAAHVREAFALAATPAARTRAALLHAHLSLQAGRGEDALDPLTRLVEESGEDPERRLALQGFAVNLTRAQLSARRAAWPMVCAVREQGELTADADPSVLIAVAAELSMLGRERERTVWMARAALERLGTMPPLTRAFAGLTATRTLIVADAHDEAERVCRAAMDAARERGALFDHVYHAVSHANLAYRAGRVDESEADVRDGFEVARGARWALGLPSTASYLVQALTERDALDEAREVLREAGLDGPPASLSDMYTSNALLLARAGLHQAAGDAGAARADLEELGRRQEAFGERNPSLSPWRSALALALAAGGEDGAAAALAEEEVALARAWGAPRALGIALRAAGLCVPTGPARLALLTEAEAVLAPSFARLEHARALASLGAELLAAGDRGAAKAALRRALEQAHHCGATALEREALAALRAAGARPRRPVLQGPGALTPSERRVTELAAAGLTNRDIAERLFVTVRTVEYHLHRAYPKLGIDERGKLADALEAE